MNRLPPRALLVMIGSLSACADGPRFVSDPLPIELAVEEVAAGLQNPLYLTAPTGDPRLFIIEQRGRVRIVEGGQLQSLPFLDIDDLIRSGGEQGLLGLAFHPDFDVNGYFYVSYTDNGGDTRVERYTVSGDPNVADRGSAKLLLHVSQPYSNHNGGLVTFGPDGLLYIGLGDGGSGGDPLGHGQNTLTLLGALLRIDVDAGDPYAVPPDNPFVADAGARGEIWAYGLRNPWRFSFDVPAGLLYIGDVGQGSWEEVSVAPAATPGLNYGWNVTEGNQCYIGNCSLSGLTLPAVAYANTGADCSVIGGFVYRGTAVPEIQGEYFYSDYCGGWLRSFRYDNGEVLAEREWEVGALGNVLSFGQDSAGELYILSENGVVYRLIAAQ